MDEGQANLTGDEEGLYCPGCGYDLRMTETGRCPECGRGFERGSLAVSRVPWVHRGELGRVRAWWKTVGMVLRRPGEMGAEVARPVGWRDARGFARVTCAVAAVMVGLAGAAMYPWMGLEEQFYIGMRLWFKGAGTGLLLPALALLTGPGVVAVAMIGTFLGSRAVIWWVRFWFWMLGGARRDRASAVACYLSAWWVPAGLLGVLHVGAWMLALRVSGAVRADLFWTGVLWGAVQVIFIGAAVVNMLVVLRRSTRCGGFGMAAAAVGVPVGGAVIFGGCVFLVNYLMGFAALALWSLWS